MNDLLESTTFHELHSSLRLTIQAKRYDKWRLLYPNVGELDGFPHLGRVAILATDGTEAYFHVGRDTIFHGHLKAFNGPVAKCYVWEDDWDYDRRCRRVHVFKRRDGSVVVIPFDKEMDEYKEMHPSYVPFGQHPDDEGYQERASVAAQRPSIKSRKQELLDTI